MDKKNLLFVMPSLSAGGGEKSLVNLLSQVDFNLYNVDLYLLSHEGIFMDLIPNEVNILPQTEKYKLFSFPLFKSIRQLLITGNMNLLYYRIMFSMINRTFPNNSKREQRVWKYLSRSIENLEKNYDAAIGFLEKTSTYLCVEKVQSKQKIGWVHIDYDQLGMDANFDRYYFDKLNKIVTVSEECASVINRRFPSFQEKIEIIYNIVSPNMIEKMARQGHDNLYEKTHGETILLSIGRLHYQKGFEFAIEACDKLVNKGYKIKWFIVGDGDERDRLNNMITERGLEDHFILLGLKSNPYPYLQQADIYVQTSRFEGKSIAIDEAKILQKPIVVTNFSTAIDQIEDKENGLIVDMNSTAISNGIELLINDVSLKNKFIRNLSTENLGTENEITKFYKMLGDNNEKTAIICHE